MTVGPPGAGWNDDNFVIDNNLYYDASGRPLNFAGATLDEWRKRGHDINSIVADPRFEDAQKYNFKLKPDSPALKVGFKPFDLSNVGPREPVGIRE